MRRSILCVALLMVAACDNFEPRDKVATYDPQTRQLSLPHPCPDWSQSQTHNYLNEIHSNFGCAVNTNSAVQLADPADLHKGHGDHRPDPRMTSRTLELYYSGEIPKPLTPMQSTNSSAQ